MEFFRRTQPRAQNAFDVDALCEHSRRIAQLLEKQSIQNRLSLLACLDDLLGAVYSLFFAIQKEYDDRPEPLPPSEITHVIVRARDMSTGRIRTEGKWAAGFYFNNALFRLAAVYHRALKAVTNNENSGLYVFQLLPKAEQMFKASAGKDWERSELNDIHSQVNGLKHGAEGTYPGRTVSFNQAIKAISQLLELMETLT